jgi:AraC-like DNA-binding protein
MKRSHFRRTIRHFLSMKATFARSEVAAGPIDLLHIADLHERFAPHMHEAYAIGVFVSGSYRLRCAGVEYLTAPGSIVALPPGVIHSGIPAGADGWTTRMFYPDEQLFRDLIEVRDVEWNASFADLLIDDPALSRMMTTAHELLMAGQSLEGEVLLVKAFAILVRRYGTTSSRRKVARTAISLGLDAVRDYIHDNVTTPIRLSTLASIAGVSPYHLIRVFGREFGVSPYAYVKQLRVLHAQRMLREGMSATEVAFAVGFSDQSHLNRAFKAMMGVTPGAFARACTATDERRKAAS